MYARQLANGSSKWVIREARKMPQYTGTMAHPLPPPSLESEVERAEDKDDSYVRCEAFPKPSVVPEEQEVDAHDDSDHD
jgi:hypothetical protein